LSSTGRSDLLFICNSYSAAIANATGNIIDVLAALRKEHHSEGMNFLILYILINPHRYQICGDHQSSHRPDQEKG
jgi:hypothetical protein